MNPPVEKRDEIEQTQPGDESDIKFPKEFAVLNTVSK